MSSKRSPNPIDESESVVVHSSASSKRQKKMNNSSQDPAQPGEATSCSSGSKSSYLPGNFRRRTAQASKPRFKMTIKPFKVKPKPPVAFESETLAQLKQAIIAVHKHETVTQSYEELYRNVQNLCLHKKAEKLYEMLYQVCDQHVQETLQGLSESSDTLIMLLQKVESYWTQYCDQMKTLRGIFLYLDRTFVAQHRETESIYRFGLSLFRQYFNSTSLQNKVLDNLLQVLKLERQGHSIDSLVVENLFQMFKSLQIYDSVLEPRWIESIEQYYRNESQIELQRKSTADYLTLCEEWMADEAQCCQKYCDNESYHLLMKTMERELIKSHAETVESTGFEELIVSHALSVLSRLYSLFCRVEESDRLCKSFALLARKQGYELVKQSGEEDKLIERLLELKEKYDEILETCFEKDSQFQHALNKSYEAIIQENENRPAELLAKYIDKTLRKGRTWSDEDMEQELHRAMSLFRYIVAKDIFEAFYKRDTAKRLLLDQQASEDTEKLMISKLRSECGTVFTTNLEGMFQDMKLSQDLRQRFQDYIAMKMEQLELNSEIEFQATVLTASWWPTQPTLEMKIPKSIERYQDVFTKFYVDNHRGRKLDWRYMYSSCVLRANFPQRKELVVSVAQAVILLQFNRSRSIPFTELGKLTGMSTDDLKRTLLELNKQRLVRKKKVPQENGTSIDMIQLNTEYKNKAYRVRLSSQMKETAEEKKKTIDNVDQDRHFQIDAAIVRIMKSRRTLTHTLLMSECIKQIKFPAQPPAIKTRIESLINREYLERDPNDNKTYRYVA